MSDIILDTNGLRLLSHREIIDEIVMKNDDVFVPKCVWRKQAPGIFIHLINILRTSARALEQKFHEVSTISTNLPDNIERRMMEHGADECDLEVTRLAYYRQIRSGQMVHLISNDPDIHDFKLLLEHDEINAKDMREFESVYCISTRARDN